MINFENRYAIYRAIVIINYAILFSRMNVVNTMTKFERKWRPRRHRVSNLSFDILFELHSYSELIIYNYLLRAIILFYKILNILIVVYNLDLYFVFYRSM